ncbi:MAG: stage II sporulation protein P, partial [Clostridia bacterium]|nr:stage II sporulation protein P [Clostridia bacterium]
RIKTGRYNQHVGRLSLLVEVGHNANTLEQALNAVPALAECLALSLADMSDEEMEDASDPVTLPLTPLGPGIDKE